VFSRRRTAWAWLAVDVLAGLALAFGVARLARRIWGRSERPVAASAVMSSAVKRPSVEVVAPIAAPRPDSPVTQHGRNVGPFQLVGVLLALLIAVLGQRTFDAAPSLAEIAGRTRELVGILLLLISMLLFGLAMPAPASAPALSASDDRSAAQPMTAHSRREWSLWLLAAALVLGIAAGARFAIWGEDGAMRLLWVASVVVYVLYALATLWDSQSGAASPRFRPLHLVMLGLLLAVGLWLRLYRLDSIPLDFHGDSASMGIEARDILLGGDPQIFRIGWADIPGLGFYPALVSMAVFGISLVGLNMSSVIEGMAVLIGTYLLGWRLFDSHRVGAIGAAVLAITVPHNHFSRIAPYMDPWPWLLFATLLLVDGLRARRRSSLTVAGVLLGVGVVMYYSGRAVPVILALWLLCLAATRSGWLRGRLVGLALFALGAALFIAPMAIYFSRNPEPLVARSRAVYLFERDVMIHSMGKYRLTTPEAVLAEQVKRSLLTVNLYPDSSTQFGYRYPMFVSALAVFFVLGLGYCLRSWRHPGAVLISIWIVFTLLVGSALTVDAPFWPRLVGVLPAAALAAALAIDRLWVLLEDVAKADLRPGVTAGATLAVGLLLAVAGLDGWQRYLGAVETYVKPQAQLGRYLASLPADVAACSLGGSLGVRLRETAFLAWPRPLVDLPAGRGPDLRACPGPPQVWVVDVRTEGLLPVLQAEWPRGVVVQHLNMEGRQAFITFEVR
jgi:hypothetical protein